jgi:hypothetical protein
MNPHRAQANDSASDRWNRMLALLEAAADAVQAAGPDTNMEAQLWCDALIAVLRTPAPDVDAVAFKAEAALAFKYSVTDEALDKLYASDEPSGVAEVMIHRDLRRLIASGHS